VADQTKERIVEAAYRTLVRQGYHETSMKDIAAEAGLAPGLAHYYFQTKEDLLVAAIEYGCRLGFARTAFELAKQELRTYPGVFQLTFDMFGVGLHNPKIAAAVRAFIDERRAFIARLALGVMAGMRERPASSADAIAAALWGSLHGIYLQKLMAPAFDADAAIDALSELAMAFATRGPSQMQAAEGD